MYKQRRAVFAWGGILSVLLTTGAAPAGSPATQPLEIGFQPSLVTVEVARGLKHLWGIDFLPDGNFLVSEKDGGLKHVSRTGVVTNIAGLPYDIDNVRQNPSDNSGLFDVALHPRFATNRWVYLAYARKLVPV